MQATPLPPDRATDAHARATALRQARLQEIRLQTQRLLAESRALAAAHQAACQRMREAVEEARARLVLARGRRVVEATRPSQGAGEHPNDVDSAGPTSPADGPAERRLG